MSAAEEKRPYLLRILGTWGAFLLLAVVLSLRLGTIPPLGELLSPATGYLRNAPSVAKTKSTQTLRTKGLKGKVTISIDTRGVPHVTAENDLDLAFGQAYATARDRLWQMELQTAAVAGKVSEILGEKAFDFDVRQRKLGFLAAAEAELEYIQKNDPEQYAIIESYSRGVNAWIESLSPADWPIEYKLIGSAPQPWTPLKCALFHKQMAWTLTGNFNDFKMTNALQKFSSEELELLFPDVYTGSQPILDSSVAQMTIEESSSLESVPVPVRLDGLLKLVDTPAGSKQPSEKAAKGSNNWVVDGVHTQHGYPVLANDPHLELKLPSIWYEIQLTAPGVNVYGVSLPGLPHVIIGFNDSVSWGITNAGADVLDWYAMKLDRTKPAPNYFFAQQWRPSTIRQETIRIKGKPTRTIDVLQTHLGPIAKEYALEQKTGGSVMIPFAMKWTGHSPSNEFRVFYELNRSHSVVEMRNALKSYQSPAQNFIMADKTGSIGYLQAGRFPVRTAGFGRYVLDGTSPIHEWREFISFDRLPQSWSPERGYLFSANQQATRDPLNGFASGDWGFTSYLRGNRIAERLAELTKNKTTSISQLKELQNDVVDLRAKTLLPLFIQWSAGLVRTDEDRKILDTMSRWNFELNAHSIEASVWSKWWDNVQSAVWEKAFPPEHFLSPSEDKTMELIISKDAEEWPASDSVPRHTELPALVATSFERALQTLRSFSARHNLPTPLPAWGKFRGTKIPHLANLPGFGIEHLETAGSDLTVNATTVDHGPSWRMVVTWINAQPRAWGIYPGGASGHVGSPHYTNMISPWLRGELQELLFVQQGQLKDSLTLSRIQLENQP